MTFPVYAEVGVAPFTVPFTITMFHTAGNVISISGSLVSQLALDSTSLPLVGDPAGVVVYTGHVTFNPSLGVASGRVPPHGWYPLSLTVVTRYGNGDQLTNSLRLSVYSVIDPSQPEAKPGDGTGIRTQSNCQMRDAHENPYVDRWGSSIIEFVQMLPLSATSHPIIRGSCTPRPTAMRPLRTGCHPGCSRLMSIRIFITASLEPPLTW